MEPAEKPVMQNSAEDWAGAMGERWLQHLERFEGMIAPVGQALMDRADIRAGERVIDVGCGGGGTSIEIARRVGPTGSVVGIDVSAPLTQAAQARARAAAARNLTFRCADAATASVDGAPFTRLFSRFGLLFFSAPRAAFANLHGWLLPGARVDFSAWAPARENLWIARAMEILGRFIALAPPVPRAPGPFALDDPRYIEELLAAGGFSGVQIEVWRGAQLVGGPGATAAEAATFLEEAMSIGALLEDAPRETRAAITAELTALFAAHRQAVGISMPASAYLVRARA
ncbi:MAG TPA: methyltransferase domain-containing protein [Steroidobacteraceae bacterium]|nr:methyltransferase domain-containing protein [Steroidobacteraceae bacterium]